MDFSLRYRTSFILSTLVIMALVIASFLLFESSIQSWFTHISNGLNPSQQASFWIAALLVIALLAFDTLLPIPSSLVSAFAATYLGLELGALVIWLGLSLGSSLGYGIGLYSNQVLSSRWLSNKDYVKAQAFSNKVGLGALAFMRGVPVLAETSVIAAGLVRYPWRPFLLVTLLANAGVALVYGYIGSQAQDMAEASSAFFAVVAAGIVVPTIAWGVKALWQAAATPVQKDEARYSVDDIQATFSLPFSYPVTFTENAFNTDNSTLITLLAQANSQNRKAKTVIIVDKGVADANPELCENMQKYFLHHHTKAQLLHEPLVIEGGETGKHYTNVEMLYRFLLKHQVDRHAVVIAIGGGAVLDTVGYACATFHRGVKLLRMPSTVLAQNDAGVGVKNGFNALNSKNLIGTFAPPLAVLNDFSLLENLPARDRRAGLAEAVKVAAIRSKTFFEWMEQNAEALATFEDEASHYAIAECARLHVHQITQSGDPFESGSARPLDFGHWAAHKLESLSKYHVRHGEAVAIGMALDTLYASKIGILSYQQCYRFIGLLERLGFVLWHPALELTDDADEPAVFAGLEEFRQHLGGNLCITLLTQMGTGKEVGSIDKGALGAALLQLKSISLKDTSKQSFTSELVEG
ncbi:3-dehydroquinate synthase [Alteromonas sp. a30]|uniref:3-dehydroquinate synthase n=1 Tax=Alteromonas sp. a30 TaxID=2730917 RepID=UPI0022823864|nr:3-dehydroquinate synthase [Alteromonas sp. a30]MCY7297263.1 3-dehydroquinate synthase [Alteromonas sp. a30]